MHSGERMYREVFDVFIISVYSSYGSCVLI